MGPDGFDVCVFFSTLRNGPGSIGRIFQAEESKEVSKGQCTLWLDLNKRWGVHFVEQVVAVGLDLMEPWGFLIWKEKTLNRVISKLLSYFDTL